MVFFSVKSPSPSSLQLETILVYNIDFNKKNTQNESIKRKYSIFEASKSKDFFLYTYFFFI